MSQKIIIVGGVAGGATLATRLRRLNEVDEIVLLEQGPYISFANCGLPYHVGGVIKNREDLLLQTPEGMGSQYNLDVRNFSQVTKIDPDKKEVHITNLETQEAYTESYDKLVLSTGAKAITPPIPGLKEAENVFSLRNIPDMDQIKAYIEEKKVEIATVIGGGFIGLEMMENLVELGLKVQLVEMSPQVMPNIDFDMAQFLHAQIDMHDVHLILNDGLKEFQDQGHKLVLNSGTELVSDMTILSIGVSPENSLAKEIGIELGFKNAIKVDQNFQTSQPDIYALGDVIQVNDFITDDPTHIPLAWPANRQARLLGDILNGIPAEYPGTMGTSAAKVFELTAAATGNSERILTNKGIDFEVIHIHPNSHAAYYPDAAPIALKLIYAPEDGKILGAQAVGSDGVDKRIDVIATAIKLGAKAPDLAGLELAYAPPYSSAKDPVNMLGYAADNLMNKRFKAVQWHQMDQIIEEGGFVLDIREDFERAIGEIKTDLWIPLSELRGRIDEVPADRPIYVYCQVGQRGYNACRVLVQHGRDAYNIDGGYKTYKQAKYQVQKRTPASKSKIQLASPSPSIQALDLPSDFLEVDACGLQCPGPILKVKENMDDLADGQIMEVKATDFGFKADIEAWAKATGNTILDNKLEDGKIVAKVMKGSEPVSHAQGQQVQAPAQPAKEKILPVTPLAGPTIQVDACGLQCPGPILKVKENMDQMADGQVLEVEATDFGFKADIEAWAKNTGNTLLESKLEGKKVVAKVMKGQGQMALANSVSSVAPNQVPQASPNQSPFIHEDKNGATMVVFSGDLDKAIASMIIASGAAAMGKQVTIFFTFWGLSILKKQSVKKSGLSKMFDIMLPKGADKLPLSKMNMGGAGSKMMKMIMKEKNVDSLPFMIERARKLGIKFVACSMSMDIMGIEKEELYDFVEIGGVAAYLGDAQDSNLNLFI